MTYRVVCKTTTSTSPLIVHVRTIIQATDNPSYAEGALVGAIQMARCEDPDLDLNFSEDNKVCYLGKNGARVHTLFVEILREEEEDGKEEQEEADEGDDFITV